MRPGGGGVCCEVGVMMGTSVRERGNFMGLGGGGEYMPIGLVHDDSFPY